MINQRLTHPDYLHQLAYIGCWDLNLGKKGVNSDSRDDQTSDSGGSNRDPHSVNHQIPALNFSISLAVVLIM